MKIFIGCVLAVLLVAVLYIVFDGIRFYFAIQRGKILSDNARRFERTIPNAQMNILVLGDSTAVGTGSADPELSTAGRLGGLYPEANIKNMAINGLRLQGQLKVLEGVDSSESFSLILIQIGANDIIHLTDMSDIERDADLVISRLSKQTSKLIVLHSGDIGEARIFPFYLRPILTNRSYKVREIYTRLVAKYGVSYVDLIDAPARAKLRDEPNTYYSADYLHLNAAGYGLWFDEISKKLI